jgi:hypothetical protein
MQADGMTFLQASDPLPQPIDVLDPSGFCLARRQPFQPRLKTRHEPGIHRFLLLFAPGAMTIEPRLLAVIFPTHPQRLARGAGEGFRPFASKFAFSPARHHQIAIAVFLQPENILFRSDSPIQDDQGTFRRAESLQHLFERPRFHRVPREHPRASHEAAPVQHQAQGHPGTIATLLLRVSPLRFPISARGPFKIGIRQVIQGDARLQSE